MTPKVKQAIENLIAISDRAGTSVLMREDIQIVKKFVERESAFQEVGIIGVDAGLCMVGDPCYIKSEDHPAHDWSKFCSMIAGQYPTVHQLNYAAGHEGLGVVVSTGYGDGCYPVSVVYGDEGRVSEIRIDFMGEDPGLEDEDRDALEEA